MMLSAQEKFDASEAKNQVDVNPSKGVYGRTDMGWTGAGPWLYRLLQEPYLSRELERQCNPKIYRSSDSHGEDKPVAYSASIQPSPDPYQRSQDKCAVETWKMCNGLWTFAAVFDGHGGHDTADYTVATLPSNIRSSLSDLLASKSDPAPETISNLLSEAISMFDASITADLLSLFPGGEEVLKRLTDDDVKAVINDQDRGGKNAAIVARCMRGTTALISLVDPGRSNLWIASLGDCVAVLGSIDRFKERADGTIVSSTHNGKVKEESDRIKGEHPGEEEVMLRDRVCGAIAVTRALGDHLFKLPSIYTSKIFTNAAAPFRISTPLTDILPRIKTPPYVSGKPEVCHIYLKKTFTTPNPNAMPASQGPDLNQSTELQRFLILCSDGLVDLHEEEVDPALWTSVVGRSLTFLSSRSPSDGPFPPSQTNPAVALLRYALGDEDTEAVSRMLTVEMMDRWMDDTTIVVVPL